MENAIKSLEETQTTRLAFATIAAMTALDKQSGAIEVNVFLA